MTYQLLSQPGVFPWLIGLFGLLPALIRLSGQGEENEDNELLKRAGDGDMRAFDALLGKYHVRIYQFCLRMLNNVDEAEELTQDVFIKLYRNLKRFRGESRFNTWLFQIARNLTLNKLKYLKRRHYFTSQSLDRPPAATENLPGRELQSPEKDTARLYEDFELQTLIRRAIDALSPENKTLILLRDMEGLSYAEVAEITGLNEGTVKSRLHRARMELKKTLEPHL
jgi:RNA polymerase sigma-70 factor, ECF subfamily